MYKLDLNLIKVQCKINDITQSDLAEILEISPRSVNRKLKGSSEFTATEILKIMNLFYLDPDRLFNKEVDNYEI